MRSLFQQARRAGFRGALSATFMLGRTASTEGSTPGLPACSDATAACRLLCNAPSDGRPGRTGKSSRSSVPCRTSFRPEWPILTRTSDPFDVSEPATCGVTGWMRLASACQSAILAEILLEENALSCSKCVLRRAVPSGDVEAASHFRHRCFISVVRFWLLIFTNRLQMLVMNPN